MSMAEQKTDKTPQNIIMENRKRLQITGVTDVDRFDEGSVILYTTLGELAVYGKELRVETVSAETGELTVEGEISSLVYGDSSRRSPITLMGRLFR